MAAKHQVGDTFFVSDGNANEKLSYAERFYREQLLSQKFGSKLVEKLVSEQDSIKKMVLDKIADIPMSSPEFAQLSSFFNTTDKFEIAEKIANDQYTKELYKSIMNSYGLDKKEIIAELAENEGKALKLREKRKADLDKAKGTAQSLSARIAGGGGAARL